MAPENWSRCACTCPSSVNRDRSDGRASFWLSTRTPSYSTHSDESPIGPSVGLVSAWIMIRSPPPSSCTSSLTVLRKLVKPSSRSWSSDRKSTRLNSSHLVISYAVFCLKKKNIRMSPHDSHNGYLQPLRFDSYFVLTRRTSVADSVTLLPGQPPRLPHAAGPPHGTSRAR